MEAPDRPGSPLRLGPIHTRRIYLNDPGALPDDLASRFMFAMGEGLLTEPESLVTY